MIEIHEAAQNFAEAFNTFAGALVEAILPPLSQLAENLQALPFRFPDETPLDYVLRVGPTSGHTIYPGEAWRWQGKTDWWGQSEKDRIADSLFHGGEHEKP